MEADLSAYACLPRRWLKMVGHQHASAGWFSTFQPEARNLDALLLGGPNLPYTYSRLTRMHELLQSTSDHRNARISLMRRFIPGLTKDGGRSGEWITKHPTRVVQAFEVR